MARRVSWLIAVPLALRGCEQPSHFILDLLVSFNPKARSGNPGIGAYAY